MRNVELPHLDARSRTKAAIWFTRLQASPLNARQQNRFEAWRALPHNRRALEAYDALWQKLERVRPDIQSEAKVVVAAGSYPDMALLRIKNGRIKLVNLSKRIAPTAWKIAAGLAGVALSIALGIGVWLLPPHEFETDAGTWMTVEMADGTVVTLGPKSLVRVELDERQRVAHVIRGEVFFKVAKDPSRPFLARTGGAIARAIGTRFALTADSDTPAITVAEGEVAVYWPGSKLHDMIRLSAGEQVAVSDDGFMVRRKIDPRVTLAWVEQRLEIRDETVSQAAAAFNRRNDLQIRIEGEELANQKMPRATFKLNDPNSFADALVRSGRAEMVREGPNLIRLRTGSLLRSAAPVK
jgi:transmembrane sensor